MELNRAWSIEMLRRCGMKLVVHNDQARLDSGALVVGNHVSWIDIYVVNAWRPTPFVSKAEVRSWPVVGWLAKQLRELVGETPLDHLTQWRMVKAANMMRAQRPMKLAAIASAVGYESESSFGKVFRRVMGMSPGKYRSNKRLEQSAAV